MKQKKPTPEEYYNNHSAKRTEVDDLLAQNARVRAIALVRAQVGCSLTEALRFVKQIED